MPCQIYISYRTEVGEYPAHHLCECLRRRYYDVCYPTPTPAAKRFDAETKKSLLQCNDVVVMLSWHALDGCQDENDYMRKELALAFKEGKNVIPYVMDGFEWPEDLPEDIRALKACKAVQAPTGDIATGISKLVALFQTPKPEAKPKKRKKTDPDPDPATETVYIREPGGNSLLAAFYAVCATTCVLSIPQICAGGGLRVWALILNALVLVATLFVAFQDGGANATCFFMELSATLLLISIVTMIADDGVVRPFFIVGISLITLISAIVTFVNSDGYAYQNTLSAIYAITGIVFFFLSGTFAFWAIFLFILAIVRQLAVVLSGDGDALTGIAIVIFVILLIVSFFVSGAKNAQNGGSEPPASESTSESVSVGDLESIPKA